MTSETTAGVPLSDADLLKLMTANGPAIARLIENASHVVNDPGMTHAKANDELPAANHAAAVRAELAKVCAAIDAAKADGYTVQFGVAAGHDGKQKVCQFSVTKTYQV
jgi:hypothetical protein